MKLVNYSIPVEKSETVRNISQHGLQNTKQLLITICNGSNLHVSEILRTQLYFTWSNYVPENTGALERLKSSNVLQPGTLHTTRINQMLNNQTKTRGKRISVKLHSPAPSESHAWRSQQRKQTSRSATLSGSPRMSMHNDQFWCVCALSPME